MLDALTTSVLPSCAAGVDAAGLPRWWSSTWAAWAAPLEAGRPVATTVAVVDERGRPLSGDVHPLRAWRPGDPARDEPCWVAPPAGGPRVHARVRVVPCHGREADGVVAVVSVEPLPAARSAVPAPLALAIEHSPASVIVTDAANMIVYVNPKFEQATGWTRAEVLGCNPRILGSGEQSRAFYDEMWATLLAGREWRGEFCNRRKDGTLYWEAASIAGVPGPDGRPAWYVAVKEDVTARRELEARLREALVRAEAGTRAKSAFLSAVSHEIRTPLNGVLGATSLLLDTALSPEQREYVETARTCGEALISLVGDVLDLTKLESGALELASLDFDVRTVVEQTAEIVSYRAREKGLEVVVLTRPDVPERLRGDPHRIRQVLLNFAGNAVKFTERGEVVVEVALDPSARDGRVGLRFSVSDTGPGIPAHRLDELFRPFHQLSPDPSHRAGGVGLGLAISRDLAERMGGRVGVSSVPGQGSTFWLSLVLEPARTPSAPADPPPRLDGRHVLLLDPSATSRFVLREQVKAWGAEPEEADDADDAVARIARAAALGRPVAVAVVDARAVGADVAGFAARVHGTEAGARVALVLLTSMPTPGDAEALRAAGYAGYLPKPVRQRHLRGVLALALERPAPAAGAQPAPIATQHVADERAQRSRPRVLVVDDDALNRKVGSRFLERAGCACDVASDADEAVRAVRSKPYDLVLMDLHLGAVDGAEATRRIHAGDPPGRRTPIVGWTASVLDADLARCRAAGMEAVLGKPLDRDSLERLLARVVAEPAAAR